MKKQILILAFLFALLLAACGGDATNDNLAANTNADANANVTASDASNESGEISDLGDFFDPDIEIIETDSGLQYQVLVQGEGAVAVAGDMVSVHYTGWLMDGTQFDSSVDRSAPILFELGIGYVISGWDEGLLGMQVGGKRMLLIPSDLAYGATGAGSGLIPPNATLAFEVELVGLPRAEDFIVPDIEVVTTDTGLIYQDLVIGEGASTQVDDIVVMDFTGYLVNGEVFATSIDQAQPISFTIGADMMIPGWDEGVLGMKIGGKRLLIIPPELAFGAQGASGVIPPNATLILKVELIGIPTVEDFLDPDLEVVTTESGLSIQEMVVGEGATAQAGDLVLVHYTGWLLDGTKFDSSVDRDEAFEFTLSQGSVIAGWDEGVAGMNVGGKRLLIIPSDLAYGIAGSGSIPPGATLVFEVELLEIK